MRQVVRVCSFAILIALPARAADDVVNQINEGLTAYKAGKLSQAASELEFAIQAIRQKQAEGLKEVFPKPPAGWKAEDPEVGAAGSMAMMGGGISAKCTYTSEKAIPTDPKDPEAGEQNPSVQVEIVGESPLLQGMMAMMANPMFATSGGGKMVKLASYKALLKAEKNSRVELSVVVGNKLLVTVKGDDGAVEKDVMAIAKGVDFAKLEKFTQP